MERRSSTELHNRKRADTLRPEISTADAKSVIENQRTTTRDTRNETKEPTGESNYTTTAAGL